MENPTCGLVTYSTSTLLSTNYLPSIVLGAQPISVNKDSYLFGAILQSMVRTASATEQDKEEGEWVVVFSVVGYYYCYVLTCSHSADLP